MRLSSKLILAFALSSTLISTQAMNISDILTPAPHQLGSGSGSLIHGDTNGTVVNYVLLNFYDNTGGTSDGNGCAAGDIPLGVMAGAITTGSIAFTNTTSISLNATSAYSLAANAGVTATGVKCIELTLADTNATKTYKTNSGAFPAFNVDCTNGSSCVNVNPPSSVTVLGV